MGDTNLAFQAISRGPLEVASEVLGPGADGHALLLKMRDIVDELDAIRDLAEEFLEPLGLSLAETVGMLAEAEAAERWALVDHVSVDYDGWVPPKTLLSKEAQSCVRRLFLAGFEPDMIGFLTNLDADRVAEWLRWRKFSDRTRRIWDLHRAGKTVNQIVSETGFAKPVVHRHLTSIGEVPNTSYRRAMPASVRARAVDLLAQNTSPAVIARTLGITQDAVQNVRRKAIKEGLLPGRGV